MVARFTSEKKAKKFHQKIMVFLTIPCKVSIGLVAFDLVDLAGVAMFRADEAWLTGYAKRTGKAQKALKQFRTKTNVLGQLEKAHKATNAQSPHKRALDALEKDPILLKGNQEHYEQVRIFWYFEQHHPDIYLRLAAMPNGGWRGGKAGGQMKAEGQKKGYPDMTLDMPKGVYHGMRIELKFGSNGLDEGQVRYLRQLNEDGYHSVHCVGMTEAVEAIMAYWYLEPGEVLPVRERDLKWAA